MRSKISGIVLAVCMLASTSRIVTLLSKRAPSSRTETTDLEVWGASVLAQP
jgi:hypothetical protein